SMHTLPLFEEPSSFDRDSLARRLRELAAQDVYLGGSSWKYEGWLGQVYTPERYFSRGRFSRKRFAKECLTEYAETFPIVCGDFSFYQFPPEHFWQNLFASAPERLKFVFKVPEEITRKTFPNHPRYGRQGGEPNPSFLNPELFEAAFVQPLLPYRNRIAVLIFEFGGFSRKNYEKPEQFFEDLDRFLHMLPAGFRYGVEVRNQEFPQPEYFAILRRHKIAHVFNAWTRMPPLDVQIQTEEAFTTDFIVARALLQHGRTYEQAVHAFSPYDRIQDESPETRSALRELIEHARYRRVPAYLFVNNRLEGNMPITINAVVE
ncbi:MAG: DUF72 domain-containing protein, partial [Bryobacteraceae bacterium]